MSFQMPASPAGSTPYQGASSPCICPYASYDRQVHAIGRAHIEVVALTAIKLLYSDEAETKKLLQICPFSRCKEVNHADPQALVDHIIGCPFSSDGEICCAGCKTYKNTGSMGKEPSHLEREAAPTEREISGRMDIRKPFRKLSSLFQASIRSSHSSVSSSRTGSMISAESPRSSREFASPRLDEAHAPPPPPQTHLCELTDGLPPRELGDTSRPFEMSGAETRSVHHLAELAVEAADAPHHSLLGQALNSTGQRVARRQQQRRVPPSPPPLQTNYANPMPHVGEGAHSNWTREGPLGMTTGNSFFGNDITESPTDIQPDVSANFSAIRGYTPVDVLGDTVSPLGSIDVSPSSSRGHGNESMFAAFQPLTHVSFGSVGDSSNVPQQSFLGNAYMHWEPSELAAPLPDQTPPHHGSQLSRDSSTMNAAPLSFREQTWTKPQPRTYSGSTSTSAGTLESTGTNSPAALGSMNPSSQPVPIASFPNRAQILPGRSSANPRPTQWRCRYQPCDYHPRGNRRKYWPGYIRKHEKKHNPEPLPCPKCGNMLSRKDNLQTHLKRSCKGLLHRMVESSRPDLLHCMHMDDSEAWVARELSMTEEDDPLEWFT